MATIIGIEVQPIRLNYAVHTKNLVVHKFERDGTINVPSSMVDKESDFRSVVLQGLQETLSDYRYEVCDLGVYVGKNTQQQIWNRFLVRSQRWMEDVINSFFETETMAIRLGNNKRFRRKILRDLDKLQDYPWTLTSANWVAFEGAKDIENIWEAQDVWI